AVDLLPSRLVQRHSERADILGRQSERWLGSCFRSWLSIDLTRIVPKNLADWGFMPPILPAPTPVSKPKLLDQVRDAIRLRHYSIRTEQVYINWIKRFILFHNKRHPTEMAEAEVRKFLSYLARIGNVAASTQNQA